MRTADEAGRCRRARAADDRGMTMVEYAFLTPVLFVFLMATVQFAVYLFAMQAAQSAVRAGGRVAREDAATMGCLSAGAKWQDIAKGVVADRATRVGGTLLTWNPSTGITATATPDGAVLAGCQASVTVSFTASVPKFMPWAPAQVTVTSTGPVEQFVKHP